MFFEKTNAYWISFLLLESINIKQKRDYQNLF